MARSRIRCDVAIIGGGPAGATAGRLLASWGRHVVLADAALGPVDKVGEAIAPSARPILETLGLAARLDSEPGLARRCLGVVSDWGGVHVRDYLREPGGHGWILDRRAFEAMLARSAVDSGVDWHWRHRLKRVRPAASGHSLILSGKGGAEVRIDADFVIDASGRAAVLARRLGARRQVASRLIAREAGPRLQSIPFGGASWLRIAAGPGGWHYQAEGPDGRLRNLSLGGATEPASPKRGWEAGFSILDRFHGPGWIAIGDAAAGFDPLTSQGIANALASGLVGARAVHAAVGGDEDELHTYESAMRATWSRSRSGAQSVYASELRWVAEPFWSAARSVQPSSTSATLSL